MWPGKGIPASPTPYSQQDLVSGGQGIRLSTQKGLPWTSCYVSIKIRELVFQSSQWTDEFLSTGFSSVSPQRPHFQTLCSGVIPLLLAAPPLLLYAGHAPPHLP